MTFNVVYRLKRIFTIVVRYNVIVNFAGYYAKICEMHRRRRLTLRNENKY